MATCKACSDPLVIQLDPEESVDGNQTVPDDLLLGCGCHFHWQCLLDLSQQLVGSLSCPACNTYLPTTAAGSSAAGSTSSAQQPTAILTRYANEGGVQEGLDILPSILEEAYLAEHPEAQRAQALHLMCGEGDVTGIVELLQAVDGDDDEEGDSLDAAALLRYQDPLHGMRSGLHLAIEKNQEEVFWLLLWLASNLPAETFPGAVAQTTAAMGLQKAEVRSEAEDIRFLRDDQGRTPADLCSESGGQWQRFVEGGLFLQ